jgi:nicotinate phosphoribosyltransferase
MKHSNYFTLQPMLSLYMKDGVKVGKNTAIKNIQLDVVKNLSSFHPSHKRMINPHIYKVSLSKELKQLKTQLVIEAKEKKEASRDNS